MGRVPVPEVPAYRTVLNPAAPKWEPFPVDALPEPIRGFVDAGARAIGCDQSYLALPLLTAIAAAIGNTRWLELREGESIAPILWGAIIGESGTRKTAAIRLVLRHLWHRESEAAKRFRSAMGLYRARLWRWRMDARAWKRTANGNRPEKPDLPQAERFIVSHAPLKALVPILLANPRGLLLVCDELGEWIRSFERYANKRAASADSQNWLRIFNAESIVIERNIGAPRTIYVPQPAICIINAIQPAALRRALDSRYGIPEPMAYLLLAWPPRKVRTWTGTGIDPIAEIELTRVLDRLFDIEPAMDGGGKICPTLVKLSADAKEAWIAYYNTWAIEQVTVGSDIAAAVQRYAARLALVIHLIRWAACDPSLAAPEILDLASMNAGIMLARWFEREARRIYAALSL